MPLISIANAYSNEITDKYYAEDSYDNEYPKDDYAGYKNELIEKFELPKHFSQPTEDQPWTQQIIPEDFPLRDLCLDGKQIPDRYITKFDIEAIEVDIVYNIAGFHDPNGRIYVLSEDKNDILEKVAANPGKPVTEVQPLTIRTNVGKCVEIKFKNDLKEEYASIHPTGIGLDPNTSDGTFVGFNDDSTVTPGETVTYRWFPDVQGAHFFTDASRQVVLLDPVILGDWASDLQTSLRQHGLFGTLVVEPRGATWTDPFTGEFLKSGVNADIHYPPGDWKQDTRERVVYYHDEAGILDPNGNEPRGPNGEATGMYTMNYRGETIDSRTNPEFYPDNCQPGVSLEVCSDPDFFYNSWVHGDPGGGD
ncbi:MAG: multicopper oxidase domain-containing protein, partial [Nitrososphaeraceae archaeon]|nr:multicopper oxidase domain-containing protein [Nitrososphaeraceae archaeon]